FIWHVTLSVLGLALLAVAFITAALYLLQFRELKSKRFGQVFRLFPPLERLDRLNHVALVAGFPALTLGVLLALGYAVRYAGGMHVDPAQIVWGSFTWVVLGSAVWMRVVRHWAGRRGLAVHVQPHRILPRRTERLDGRDGLGHLGRAPRCRSQCQRVRLLPARPRGGAPSLPRLGGPRLDDPRRVADPGPGARGVGS